MSLAGLGFPLTFDVVFSDYTADIGKVKISGDNVQLRTDTLNIATKVEERSTCKFQVITTIGIMPNGWPYTWPILWGTSYLRMYRKGEPVEVYDDTGDMIWSGFIESSVAKAVDPSGKLYHTIKCIDNHYLADKRIIADSWVNTASGDIVRDIITDTLADEGITVGVIQDGSTLISVIANYVSATVLLDRLALESNFTWWIDKDKNLYFVDRATITTPWIINRSDVRKHSASLTHGNPLYRNVQYEKGGTTVTAPQTLSFTGDGEATTFTMGFPIDQVPTITLNGGVQTVGIKGIDTGKDWYWNKGDSIVSQEYEATVLTALDTLEVTYIGQYKFVTYNEDTVEIAAQLVLEEGGTGRVEDVDDNPHVTELDEAQEIIDAKLDYYGVAGLIYDFQTFRSGLEVGQLATINDSAYNLEAEEMLITNVRIQRQDKRILYTVQAVQGPITGSWTKFFRSLVDLSSRSKEISVGDDSTLIIVAPLSGSIEVSGSLSTTVWACHVPGPALFPGPAIFPC